MLLVEKQSDQSLCNQVIKHLKKVINLYQIYVLINDQLIIVPVEELVAYVKSAVSTRAQMNQALSGWFFFLSLLSGWFDGYAAIATHADARWVSLFGTEILDQVRPHLLSASKSLQNADMRSL